MIGLDIDGYGEWLNISCTECGWVHTLDPRTGWFERDEPTYLIADIVALADAHDCNHATLQGMTHKQCNL